MDAQKKKALVIEADSIQRDLIILALKKFDCDVLSTKHVNEALELIRAQPPSLVVMDAFLPEKNGFDLLQDLKKMPSFADVKVLMISALGFPEVVRRAKEMGVSEFLVKPLDFDLLVARLRSIMVEMKS